MTISCFFRLNSRNLSALVCPGLGNMPAYSGAPGHLNDPSRAAIPEKGPLPPGRYYIVDSQSGGKLGWLKELSRPSRTPWFALYRIDGKIDDYTFVEGVKRGHFRLRAIGRRAIDNGCITVLSQKQFDRLHALLLAQKTHFIPGTDTRYFGMLDVS